MCFFVVFYFVMFKLFSTLLWFQWKFLYMFLILWITTFNLIAGLLGKNFKWVHDMKCTPRKRPHNSHSEGDQPQKCKCGKLKKRIFFSTHYPLFLDTADDGVTVFQNMILLQKELEKINTKRFCYLCLNR